MKRMEIINLPISHFRVFVAYKFAAEMGVLPSDFLEVAQSQSNIDSNQMPKEYTWGITLTQIQMKTVISLI